MFRTKLGPAILITGLFTVAPSDAKSALGNHSDISIQDVRFVSNELAVVALKIDSFVKGTSLREKLFNDSYLTAEVQGQSFYLVKYPLNNSKNTSSTPRSCELFYTRDDGQALSFKILPNGMLLQNPVIGRAPNSTTKPDTAEWSFAVYDPRARKNVGPVYYSKKVMICFNQSFDRFVANARLQTAFLKIDGEACQLDALYQTDTGFKLRPVSGFSLDPSYGISQWAKLTQDGRYYVLFNRTPKSGPTQNLCIVKDTVEGSSKSLYTSNLVTAVENMGTKLLFFSISGERPESRKPMVFDELGNNYIFPGALPSGFHLMHWNTADSTITFVSYPELPEGKRHNIEPLRTLCWNYAAATADEQDFKCEQLYSLRK